MIRYFCDHCDRQLDEIVVDALNPRRKMGTGQIGDQGNWTFEIITGKSGCSNKGNLCPPCFQKLLLRALKETFTILRAGNGSVEQKNGES